MSLGKFHSKQFWQVFCAFSCQGFGEQVCTVFWNWNLAAVDTSLVDMLYPQVGRVDVACSSQPPVFWWCAEQALASLMTLPLAWICQSLRSDKNPRVSLHALIVAKNFASAELRLTKACVRLLILMECDPHNVHPPEVNRRVLLHPSPVTTTEKSDFTCRALIFMPECTPRFVS